MLTRKERIEKGERRFDIWLDGEDREFLESFKKDSSLPHTNIVRIALGCLKKDIELRAKLIANRKKKIEERKKKKRDHDRVNAHLYRKPKKK
jgi:hypothetical protein